jgi:hypothetical protein
MHVILTRDSFIMDVDWGSDIPNKEFCGLLQLLFKNGKSHLGRNNGNFLPHPTQFTTQLSPLLFKANMLN